MTHHRPTASIRTLLASGVAALLAFGTLGSPSSAHAQAPDLRVLRPDVILLVDTSGSMDYAMGSASGVGGALPVCSGNAGSPSGRSRWITLLEALTGTYSTGYYCDSVPRSSYVGAPDQYSPHPFARAAGMQATDGILDSNLDFARFGLFTYDNLYGINPPPAGAGPESQYMLDRSYFLANLALISGPRGDYSYGNAYDLTFPGCGTTYRVNGGARRAASSSESFGGSLISVGPASADIHTTNAAIQTALLNARPYGSTPTGAMLDDLRYYLQNDPDAARIATAGGGGDPYQACRRRYAVLITDGESSDPFRTALHCNAGGICPYDLPANIAADLCRSDGTRCTGLLNGLFVVAYAASSSPTGAVCRVDTDCGPSRGCVNGHCGDITPELNLIAANGGTTRAILAVDSVSLRAAISNAVSATNNDTLTRTTPAFMLTSSSYAAGTIGATSAPQEQYQIGTGFVPSDITSSTPWRGVLDRTHYVCDSTLTPVVQPLTAADHFADVLNARSTSRQLYTVVVPAGAQESGIITATATPDISGYGRAGAITQGRALATFNSTNLTPQHFGLAASDTTTSQAIIDYVYGVSPAPAQRVANRLGDIYHSSPAIVTAPRVDIDDQAYSLFRQRADVATRPSMLYVGSNDGVMHAFTLEDDPSGNMAWTAGQELWGFVPPTLLASRLNAGRGAHQFMVDGTPIVRDVVFRRLPGDAASSDMYHTVMVFGLRQGGNAYIALDVTDPIHPAFLWQWSQPNMGLTYARPAIGQVMVSVNGTDLQERAVAILPGGASTIDSAAAAATGTAGCPSLASSRPATTGDITTTRVGRHCWNGLTGRYLWVVDLATGELLRQFDASLISSPITGGVALYSGDTGQFATHGYVADADGVLWALDLSVADPTSWTFTPLHDLFWADAGTAGQPVYDPPAVTVDASGNPTIVIGAGDQDNLESLAPSRVVSVTEVITQTSAARATSVARVNWEMRTQPGEQVTGPIVLFGNYAYFATWWNNADPTNACSAGTARLWGVHFLDGSGTAPVGYTSGVSRFPTPGLNNLVTGATDTFYSDLGGNPIFGVAVAQRPSCTTGANVNDTYLGSRYQVSNLNAGTFQLVAQVSGRPATTTGTAVSSVQTVTVANLPPPPALSRALTYQPAADF